jgi:predicted nucleic acid-binding protein
MDLSIAAITLDYDGIVVTRHRRDFEQVPDLQIENWSQAANGEWKTIGTSSAAA